MDFTEVLTTAQQSLITIISLLISTGAIVLTLYLNKLRKRAIEELNKISDNSTKDLAEKSINRIVDLTVTVVDSIQQELVYSIKEGITNGTNTKEDLTKLKDLAVSRIMSQITPSVKEAAMNQITDVEKYVKDLVSQEVLILRLNEENNKTTENEYDVDCEDCTNDYIKNTEDHIE